MAVHDRIVLFNKFFKQFHLVSQARYLFCEEKLVKVLKGSKNNKASGADNVVNEIFLNMVVVRLDISY